MSVGSSTEILVLSNIQAKALAGSLLAIGEDLFRLKDYDPAYPGQPPWRSGAEGKAYPLLARDGTVAAYLKFFTRPTQKRLNRTAWLIGQQMHTWLPGLSAAPLLWVNTRLSPRSAEIDFDFAGYLAQAVPGETWLELKHHIVEAGVSLPADVRWRCVEDLVLATAVLERAGHRSWRLVAQQHRHRPRRAGRRPGPVPDRFRRLRGPGGRAGPGHRRGRRRHLRHRRLLPAGPRHRAPRAMARPRPIPTVTGATC